MDFSNKVLGKSIVAVIYTSYETFKALDYVTKVDNFFGSRLVNKWMGAFIIAWLGRKGEDVRTAPT